MAVRRINAATRRLNWGEVEALLLRDDEDVEPAPVEVCESSLDDWNRYVRSERQQLKSRFMEWRDGRIWIVELPTRTHEDAVYRFTVAMAVGTGNAMGRYLRGHQAGYIENPPAGVASFGPSQHVAGAVLPRGLGWREFHTVKVEVGVCVGWRGLNDRAAIWRQYPGVQYIVLIRLSPTLRVRQYRLEQRVNGQFPDTDARLNIVNGTVLSFDAHELLGLLDGADLPDGFHDPVIVDLFDLVEYVRG